MGREPMSQICKQPSHMSSRPTKGIDIMSPHHLMIMRTLSVPLYLYYHCFPYRLFRKVLLTLLGEVSQNLNKMYLHVKVALIGI